MVSVNPRETLDRHLNQIKNDLLILGSMVEQATIAAVQALNNRDIEMGRRVYLADYQINDKRFAIETDCVSLIATQQPLARDLRLLASILEVITELERMGDYAKHIGRICVRLSKDLLIMPLIDISLMAEKSVGMLHRSLTAFVDQNVDMAYEIPAEDDFIDDLYNTIYRELVAIMISNPGTIDQANLLLWVSHNLERLADRVTNICERTIYVVTGDLKELSVTDDEVQDVIQ